MPLKVLILSRNYPNNVIPQLGLWVEGLVHQINRLCEVRVLSPVPYCPPLPGLGEYLRYRSIVSRRSANGIEVLHPRFFTGPGYYLHSFEAHTYYWSIRRQVEQFRHEFPFDLIHAHFTYPDGVAAAKLGQRHRTPVIITEHAPWLPWMEDYPRVRRQALWAFEQCAFHIAVSRYLRNTVIHFTGEAEKLRLIPVGVDSSVFAPPSDGCKPDPNQILFVGFMRHVKGIDILLKAVRQLVHRIPPLRLVLAGGGFYRQYRLHEEQMRCLTRELGLEGHVEFTGIKSPREVAELMRQSAVLVLPSRAESFGAVLLEALACGVPVVATRSGGPEDIVTEKVGVLVPKEDENALAKGIEEVLQKRDWYNPLHLSAYARDNFSWEHIAHRTFALYEQAMERFHGQVL